MIVSILVVVSWWTQPSRAEQVPTVLRGRLDELVREELTRGWYPRAVDRQRGGFHQNFARDWTP
ncbi:MAG TPA: hypothetical protein VFF52_08550, partial [Isosphaeraceae bacterium]|nr:hypothetical protein [Isosphaeraceae bacterium]